MENIKTEKSIYPVITLISSIIVFIFGMIIGKSKYILIYCIMLIILYTIFSYGKITFKILLIFAPISLVPALLAIPVGGIGKGIEIYFRFICFILAAIPSLALKPIDLVRNLNKYKIPKSITLGILITIKFIPIIIKEIKQVYNAMKTRGIKVSILNLKVIYRALIIPILIRILSISDLLAMSLETRGFIIDDKESTIYETIEFTKRDFIYIMMLLIIVIAIGYFFSRGI